MRLVNDKKYQHETSEYRNRASHAIAPRLGVGITQTVVRTVVPATKMEKQADGTYKEVNVPDKVKVRYGFGGTNPLDFEESRISNLQQYLRARECYRYYIELVRNRIEAIELSAQNA